MSEQPTPPIRIHTTAPIPVVDLKRKFTENIEFVIDVDNSRLKGRALLTYLSNLNIDVRLTVQNHATLMELVGEYLNTPVLVSLIDLEDVVINLLLDAMGRPSFLSFDPDAFIVAHHEIIDTWLRRVQALPLYALYCKPSNHAYVEAFPEDTDDSMNGVNFVHLIKHEMFPLLVADIPESAYTWNKTFFKEYVFAGSNLFEFFAVDNNPLFMGLMTLEHAAEGQAVMTSMDTILHSSTPLLKGTDHVPSAQ